MAVLVFGAILVAGLVVWALTRTVEPAAPAAPAAEAPYQALDTASTAALATSTSTATEPAATPSGDPASVPRIALEDLRAQMGRNEVTIIDVREPSAFAAAHIPGAINMPMATIEAQVDTLPKDKPIVTYCT